MSELLSRWRIIIPAEHGSWSLMITPFIIGVGIAGAFNLPALLCLLAVLGLFLARQPLTLWYRVYSKKARKTHGPPAIFWSSALLLVVIISGLPLVLQGRAELLWLALPAGGILLLTLILTMRLGTRNLLIELIGVIGLALSGPAGYIASSGKLDQLAWLVWGIVAVHNVISLLYVRLRIDEQHGRSTRTQATTVILGHVVGLVLALFGGITGILSIWIAVPVIALMIRAIYVAWRRPPIEDVKRFGFTEMGLALLFAIAVILIFRFL